MSSQSPVYHESNYQQGQFKNGTWHCKHGDRAAERVAINSGSLAYVGLKFWICVNRPSCRFYLWEDHVVDALKFHEVPEDVIVKMTPRKRKRDGDITEYFPITPKTPRTRDVEVHGSDTDEDLYELSDRERSPSNRHRDSSPSPLPRRSNAPSRSLGPPSPSLSEEDTLRIAAAAHANANPPVSDPRRYSVLNTLLSAPLIQPSTAAPQIPVHAPPRPRTPPPTQAPANALAPSPALEPRTPRSNRRGRMPPPDPLTPGSGRRKLSLQELDTYNVVVKALVGANVKLSVKGQNALRDIIKEEDFWIGS